MATPSKNSGRDGVSRRSVLKLGAALPAAALLAPRLALAEGQRRHGLAIFDDLAQPADFSHFPYVNPDAPKGGRLVFAVPNWLFNQDTQSFDTLNSFVLKGTAPPRMELCFDSLMVRALNEPDAIYGLVAESVEVSEDGTTYLFHLRPEARFHDGTPLTAEDVAFSYNTLKTDGHPHLAEGLRELVNAEAIDATMVELTFSGKQSLAAPLEAATYPILSRAYWDGRDFTGSTLEPVLGSGPYKVGRFEQGRFVEYVRVDDYWAAGLPVNVGQNNFDVLRIEFYRERQAEFEAFKKGDILYRQEFSSKSWATEYNFPAVNDGRVIRGDFPSDARPSMQGWYPNLRRPKFADPRTRQALDAVFDFEWTNKNLFFGLYERQASFFEKSDLAAAGEPSPEELALLEPHRAALPAEVFGPAVMPSVSDGSGRDRNQLRRAAALLAEAGWKREGNRLVSADGAPFTIEFLIEATIYERILTPYVQSLSAIGVDATIRLIDTAQYQQRVQDFDFDIIGRAFSVSATPVESLDAFFHSRLASRPGSYNVAGVAHPVVDELITLAGKAKSRAELTTTVRALDRVLRALYIWIPNWYASVNRVAYWDRFGRPAEKPAYGFPIETTWWIDPAKAG